MQHRTKNRRLRLTLEEDDFIVEQAKAAGLTVSEFMRRRALSKRIVSKADLQLINQVSKLGGLMKHLASVYPEQRLEFGKVLNETILFLRSQR